MADLIINSKVIDADRLAAALAADSVAVAKFTNTTTRAYGARLLTAVRGRASGRPGPRAQTGDYRRSITLQFIDTPVSVSAAVGTNSPQGPRLEYGFNPGVGPQHGVDVLGRHYDQPPFEHFGPGFDEISAQYRAAMEHGVAAIIREGRA